MGKTITVLSLVFISSLYLTSNVWLNTEARNFNLISPNIFDASQSQKRSATYRWVKRDEQSSLQPATDVPVVAELSQANTDKDLSQGQANVDATADQLSPQQSSQSEQEIQEETTQPESSPPLASVEQQQQQPSPVTSSADLLQPPATQAPEVASQPQPETVRPANVEASKPASPGSGEADEFNGDEEADRTFSEADGPENITQTNVAQEPPVTTTSQQPTPVAETSPQPTASSSFAASKSAPESAPESMRESAPESALPPPAASPASSPELPSGPIMSSIPEPIVEPPVEADQAPSQSPQAPAQEIQTPAAESQPEEETAQVEAPTQEQAPTEEPEQQQPPQSSEQATQQQPSQTPTQQRPKQLAPADVVDSVEVVAAGHAVDVPPPQPTPAPETQLKSETEPGSSAKVVSEPETETEPEEETKLGEQTRTAKQSNSEGPAVVSNKAQAETNNIVGQTAASEQYYPNNYQLDPVTCSSQPLLEASLPEQVLNMTIDRILNLIGSQNCSDKLDLKLQPTINKQVKGHVMEVNSMPVNLVELLGSATRNLIRCSRPIKVFEDGKEKISMQLFVRQEFDDERQLASEWRRYPRLHLDDIPLEMFGSSRGASGGSSGSPSKSSAKCQRFKIESGNFNLKLLSFKWTLVFNVTLAKLEQRPKAYAVKRQLGGQIQLAQLSMNELYIDHELTLGSKSSTTTATGAASARNFAPPATWIPTVQIIHDHNNHYRRNNWLLDMYGNWLRHEYRGQLNCLLGVPLRTRLNSCLIDQAEFHRHQF